MQSLKEHLMKVNIYHINAHYKSIYENTEKHQEKDRIRSLSVNILQQRACQEVQWINQKVAEFQILGSLALQANDTQMTRYFTGEMTHWQNKRQHFLIWTKDKKDLTFSFQAYVAFKNIGQTYQGDLNIANFMMDNHLESLGNPYAFPSITEILENNEIL